jgi:hypothetical protein
MLKSGKIHRRFSNNVSAIATKARDRNDRGVGKVTSVLPGNLIQLNVAEVKKCYFNINRKPGNEMSLLLKLQIWEAFENYLHTCFVLSGNIICSAIQIKRSKKLNESVKVCCPLVDIIKIEHFLCVYGVQNCSANGPGADNKKAKQGVGRLRQRIASSLDTFPGISTTWIGATRIVD